MSSVSSNLKRIKEDLPKEVTLVAVSKTKSAELIKEAYDEGQRDFGENKVQELCEKIPVLPEDIRWHLIGHLQTNKVKNVVGKVFLIQSVDSKHLADEIEKCAAKLDVVQKVLVQVNVAHEEQKSGIDIEDAEELCEYIRKECKHIMLVGLMQVAPDTDDLEYLSSCFTKLSQLKDKLNLEILSMGMSGDYNLAIKCGSNMVRLGSSIFGQREYILK